MHREKEEWKSIYQNRKTPWDTGVPEPYLVKLIDDGTIRGKSALDLGCGTGNEAIFLAQRGFEVTGVDISGEAIEEAKRRALDAGVECDFVVVDVLDISFDKQYDFVVDRACFHFLNPKDRERYIDNLAGVLRKGGTFLLFASSDAETVKGPYQFSEEDIKMLFEPYFDIQTLELVTLNTHKEKPRPYMVVMSKK